MQFFQGVGIEESSWIDIVGICVFLLPFTFMITKLAMPLVINAYVTGEVSSNAGGLIRWPARLMIPLGFFLLTLQGLSEIIKRAAALTGHIAVTADYERPLQ